MKAFQILLLIFFLKTIKVFGIDKTTDKISALVNHHVILYSDIKNKIDILQNNINDHQNLSQNTLLYHNLLNQLIIDNLIFQAAKSENIKINHNQCNKIIHDIACLHNMTTDQFSVYVKNTGLNYERFYSKIFQEILKKKICNHIVLKRLHVPPHEINAFTSTMNFIKFNKQFKLTHIVINVPIQPSLDEINKSEDLAKLLINNIKYNNNDIQYFMHTYYNNNIFPKKIIQETEWVSWKNIPPVFDQYLETAKSGEVIGPVHSHDGIHILKINDICFKQNFYPIIRIKINSIISKDISKNIHIQKQLLQIKNQIENNNTTFALSTQERANDFYLENYENSLGWIDLDNFDPITQQSLLDLKKNQISMPIHTVNGWCLIKLIDIVQLDRTAILRERAYHHIFNQRFTDIVNDWIQELKSKSYIKIIK